MMNTKNSAKGAETPSTLTIVIINTGRPFPSPCKTLPVVIPTEIKGYANAKICKKLTAMMTIDASSVKNLTTCPAKE